jgi:hypothetical protein
VNRVGETGGALTIALLVLLGLVDLVLVGALVIFMRAVGDAMRDEDHRTLSFREQSARVMVHFRRRLNDLFRRRG